MRRRAILLFTVIAAIGCETQRAIPAPPADSYTTRTVQVKIGDFLVSANAAAITPDFFPALQVHPLLGRLFLENEYRRADGTASPAIQAVAILSQSFWTEKYAASPGIIGQKVDIDGHGTVIVGILPRTITAPGETQLWMPDR